MKKSFLIAAGTAVAAIAVSVSVCTNNGKKEPDGLFHCRAA